MVRVKLWGSLRAQADGQEWVEVEASTFKEVLDQLCALHPGLTPQVKRGVSLAIDGEIIRDAWLTKVRPENELILMPFMVGG